VVGHQIGVVVHCHPVAPQLVQHRVLLGAAQVLGEVDHHLTAHGQVAQGEPALVGQLRRMAPVAAPDRAGRHQRSQHRSLGDLEDRALVGRQVGAAEDPDLGMGDRQVLQPAQEALLDDDVVVQEHQQVPPSLNHQAIAQDRPVGSGDHDHPRLRQMSPGQLHHRGVAVGAHQDLEGWGRLLVAQAVQATAQQLRTASGSYADAGHRLGARLLAGAVIDAFQGQRGLSDLSGHPRPSLDCLTAFVTPPPPPPAPPRRLDQRSGGKRSGPSTPPPLDATPALLGIIPGGTGTGTRRNRARERH